MFQNVRGMDDFYPAEKAVQAEIFSRWKGQALKFGFTEVESPALEYLDVLTAKSGEEITEQIFTLKTKGGEDLGLRFDLTVPLTRMFASRQKELPKPVKWFALSRMWRYERPQRGRNREFYQLSAELFGSPSVAADAEVVRMLIGCLESVGLNERDVVVRVNNRELVEGILEGLGLPLEVASIVDRKSKLSPEDFIAELQNAGVKDAKLVEAIFSLEGDPADVAAKLKGMTELNEKATEGLAKVTAMLDLVPPDYTVLSMCTVRGLAYYTGNVFECFDRQGKFRALAGGGRYDNLVGLMGGEPCPACGFGLGYSTILELLKELNSLPKLRIGPEYYVAPVDESVFADAWEIADALRKKFNVSIDLLGRKLGKQMDYANSIGAIKVVIVGKKDLEEKQVTVRDLISGNEKQVPISKLTKGV